MNNKNTYLLIFILTCIYGFKVVQSASPGSIESRIYGGYPIAIEDAPFQVSVRLKKGEAEKFGFGHICGGSVISTRVVLTAAHCIAVSMENPLEYRSPDEFTLVMGDTHLTKKDSKTQQFSVLQIVVHPNFNTLLYNDLAVMFFDGNVTDNFGSAVRPIALNTLPLTESTICTVSGWGKINSHQIPDNLMETLVPIVSQKSCEKNYGFLPQSMVCAGFMTIGGHDACQGDSGGPLVCNHLLAGIVSWGIGCAEPGYPGIYTNVSYYAGWIESTNATFNYSYYVGGTTITQSSFILLIFCGIMSIFK